MKNIKLTCFVVDDRDQKRNFEAKIQQVLTRNHIEIELITLNPPQECLDTEAKLVTKENLIKIIEEKINGKTVHLLITDFNFAPEEDKISSVTGLDVLEYFQKNRPKVEAILYSGDRCKAISYLLEQHTTAGQGASPTKDNMPLIKSLENLWSFNIKAFIERTEYHQAAISILREKANSLKDIFISKLNEYPDSIFKSCYPRFASKTYAEIASEIEKNTNESRDFQHELIEQVFVYMQAINED